MRTDKGRGARVEGGLKLDKSKKKRRGGCSEKENQVSGELKARSGIASNVLQQSTWGSHPDLARSYA